MNELFVTYEQTLAVNELGFDGPCIAAIDQMGYVQMKGNKSSPRGSMMYDVVDCPFKQQVFKWFRKKYGLDGFVFNSGDNKYSFNISDNYFLNTTYEEAENACIDKLIEIAKQQDNEQIVIKK